MRAFGWNKILSTEVTTFFLKTPFELDREGVQFTDRGTKIKTPSFLAHDGRIDYTVVIKTTRDSYLVISHSYMYANTYSYCTSKCMSIV